MQPQAREKAEKEGFEVSIAKTSFKANTKALAENEGEGLAKVTFQCLLSASHLYKKWCLALLWSWCFETFRWIYLHGRMPLAFINVLHCCYIHSSMFSTATKFIHLHYINLKFSSALYPSYFVVYMLGFDMVCSFHVCKESWSLLIWYSLTYEVTCKFS